MKNLYYLGIAIGLGLLIYFYGFNFDNMSETELVNAVLYWYVPLIFGIYGIAALYIKKKMKDHSLSPVKYVFSGKDGALIILVALIGCGGLIGLFLFLIPLALVKVADMRFDLKVALLGTALCLLLLYLFFKVLWPAL
ncbi:hypothetical protein POV27_05015 [Aureisphaera galaxeae]|uniref:hypothetical protein n=1 Tax=Aureisphaera galaxeae TaxID=1538023 RepID=UPI00234FE214|nr:hypothetical protein [Aureisphaera galaxeae]MDC8003399.1 hypothetical protein [Aureisphaera galaxeae]